MRQATDTKTPELALNVTTLAGRANSQLLQLRLSDIDAEDQVRTTSGIDDSLDELAADIKARGVLWPILVRYTGNGRITLVAHIAGLETIPALLTQADADQVLEIQLAENIHRENLDLAELAAAVRRLFDKHGDLSKIGDIVKKSLPCLLRLPPAEAIAGWDLHPLESIASSRRTSEAGVGDSRVVAARRIGHAGSRDLSCGAPDGGF